MNNQNIDNILRLVDVSEQLVGDKCTKNIKISFDYISSRLPELQQIVGFNLNKFYKHIVTKKPLLIQNLSFECDSFAELRLFIDMIHRSTDMINPIAEGHHKFELDQIQISSQDKLSWFQCTINKTDSTMKMYRDTFLSMYNKFNNVKCKFELINPVTSTERYEKYLSVVPKYNKRSRI